MLIYVLVLFIIFTFILVPTYLVLSTEIYGDFYFKNIEGRKVLLNSKEKSNVKINYDYVYKNYSNEGFSTAVLEEYLLCIIITIASIYFRTYIVWLGAFIAFSLHLFFHIIQSIIIKRYIPALSTSIILLPISLVLINTVIYNAKYSIFSITISSIFCLILMMLNLKFVHKLMDKVTEIIKICE